MFIYTVGFSRRDIANIPKQSKVARGFFHNKNENIHLCKTNFMCLRYNNKGDVQEEPQSKHENMLIYMKNGGSAVKMYHIY